MRLFISSPTYSVAKPGGKHCIAAYNRPPASSLYTVEHCWIGRFSDAGLLVPESGNRVDARGPPGGHKGRHPSHRGERTRRTGVDHEVRRLNAE